VAEIQKNIDDDELVSWAEEIVLSAKEELKELENRGEKGRTQASKAIEVARESNSLRVFNNWLRYQTARSDSGEFWGMKTKSGKSLAQSISEKIREIKEMKNVMRFLGFFYRALVGVKYFDQIPYLTEGGGS
jgi:hypothetical protein